MAGGLNTAAELGKQCKCARPLTTLKTMVPEEAASHSSNKLHSNPYVISHRRRSGLQENTDSYSHTNKQSHVDGQIWNLDCSSIYFSGVYHA